MKDNIPVLPLSYALSVEDCSASDPGVFVIVHTPLSCQPLGWPDDNLYLYKPGSDAYAQGRKWDGSSLQRIISIYSHTMSRQTYEEQVVL